MIPDDSNRIPVNLKLLIRFLSKIKIDPSVIWNGTPCWLWTARIGHDGYGYFWFEGRDHTAQRIAHGMFISIVAPEDEVDHLCRVRPCVNPAHLEGVPPYINAHRSMSPTGIKHRQTHCVHGHEFTPENTYTRVINGLPHRYCRECRKISQQTYERTYTPEQLAHKRAYNREYDTRKRKRHKLNGANWPPT